jgi:DNA-binding MarR family transcriptional regulator
MGITVTKTLAGDRAAGDQAADDRAADDTRKELTRLTQLLVVEGARVAALFAANHGLHQTDVEALTRLMVAEERCEPMTAGRLAMELGLTTGAITFLLDRLERAEHIIRERDPADRRKILLRYSARGRAVAEEFFGPTGHQADTTADRFTTAELNVVRRYLEAATNGMTARRESPQS